MASLPYMQFYPSDWMGDCQILTLAARGAWQTIICKAWHPSTRGVVTLKLSAWARLFGATVEQAEKVIAEIEETQIADVVRDGDTIAITCRRIVRDWQAAEDRHAALAEAGRKGGQAKARLKPGHDEAISQAVASQKPEARIQKPVPPKPPDDGQADGDFWENVDWNGLSQAEAFGLLSQHFPDRDVWGEYSRLKKLRSDQGQKVTWKSLVSWLKKASPVLDLGRKKPSAAAKPGAKADESLPDPVHWPEYLAAFPVFAGMHFAQLTAAQQEVYHEWAMPLVRRDWEESKEGAR